MDEFNPDSVFLLPKNDELSDGLGILFNDVNIEPDCLGGRGIELEQVKPLDSLKDIKVKPVIGLKDLNGVGLKPGEIQEKPKPSIFIGFDFKF